MLIGPALRLAPAIAARTAFYLRSQRWSVPELARYQDRMLRRLIRHAAAHVPYYRNLFRAIGLDPATFRGRADLHRIPLLDKETLRTRPDEFAADNAAAFHPVAWKTSGSTGTPLRFLLSAASRINDAAVTLRAYQWAGFLPGMKILTVKGFLRDWETRYSMAGRSLNFDSVQMSPESAARLWRRVNRMKPAFFHGYPLSLILLSKLAREAGIAYHRPQTIICFGESLTDTIRGQLRAAYGNVQIFDFYGMTENAALITECGYGTRHVVDDYVYHEFVGDGNRVITEGKGEIVGTGYYNYAMPMIRYRTRDYVRLKPVPWGCVCGRPFRTVETIEGRKEDYICTPDGRTVNLVEGAVGDGVGIVTSQYVQDLPDHMYVNIVPGPDFQPESLKDVEKGLRARVGPAIRIDFRVVNELERRPGESGKTPFLISKIGSALYTGREF